MFKSLLPSRRVPSVDFQMVTSPVESASNGKENFPGTHPPADARTTRPEKSKKRKVKEQPVNGYLTSEAFEKLLDDMQIPENMREKLATMDASVKAAFLKSSKEMAMMNNSNPNIPLTPRGLRKAHSSESLSSPRPPAKHSFQHYDLSRAPEHPRFMGAHNRGVSFDAGRQPIDVTAEPLSKVPKDKRGKTSVVTPAKWASILASVSTVQLEVETAKKLRVLLRNEPLSWTQEFLREGGYSALLTRLDEILQVEWREEQHGDKILHELLRCLKAFSTSAIGCAALRSQCPAPYPQLISLLYSDKRPGEVSTRQLIIELLLILFDVYPPSSLPAAGSPATSSQPFGHARSQSVPWENDVSLSASSSLITLPAPHSTLFSLIKSLLLIQAPPPAEQTSLPVEPHAFIEGIHLPRIYKTYMEELNNVCRDYFWVFCHPNNTIWNLEETDDTKVEKPRAPGGMTGGVEFEAMTYMTTHFKFINALAKLAEDLRMPPGHECSAFQFHKDMFLSGIERIVLMGRKASTTYYPTLHLEIARYVAAAGRSGYEVPWSTARYIGSPPSGMRKSVARTPKTQPPVHASRSAHSVPSSPTKSSAPPPPGPVLPGMRKVTPMFGLRPEHH
ncbi:uncharacterized protein FIBRA_05745 [Fibroporia radiculosa]|uniref:Formin GTPase-binding domain-containing protein n=1 Tax=Fibroporia radiculosa TaxID=599839 RepID=J4HY19_9APHY|nr:uncharacterized protein FIBRA_05745 [Fibroporia radiculosa]CCM03607.1 predicted protein [Fibroporia radiculosa]